MMISIDLGLSAVIYLAAILYLLAAVLGPHLLDPRSRETANGPKIWYLWPMNGPKILRFWIETRVIDNSQVHQYSSFRRKRAFIFPSAASGRNQMADETYFPITKKSR